MAELALLAGLGYAGYISEPDQKHINNKTSYDDKLLLDDNKYSEYHSNIIQKTDLKIQNKYKQREKDTMDPKKFLIPVYYGLDDESKQMGTSTEINKPIQESFTSQFELQKFNSKNTVPVNDGFNNSRQNEIASKNGWSVFEDFNTDTNTNSDMTYGIVPASDKSFTHNNMNIFNRMRDIDTPVLRDSRKLEYFSGSSKTYTPKKETEPFFKPVSGNTWGQGGMPGITTFVQNRMNEGIKMEKRKQKPFEPRKIGPGIGLGINQDSLGGLHDTSRILPRTIDELRRKDDQRITYTPPVLPGKKGEGRSIIGTFEHRNPDKFRSDVEPVKSGGQFKGLRTPDNINIDIGNRTFSTPVIGPAGSSTFGFSTPNMKGEIKAPKNKQLQKFNQGPAQGNVRSLQNKQSFAVTNTQRIFTNTELNGNVSKSQGTNAYDPTNIPNPTQQLNSFNSVGPNNVRQGINTYDPTNIPNPTQQLNSFNSVGPNNVRQGINTYDPTNIANPTQQLNSFNSVGPNNVRQGFNAYDPTITANPTQQLNSFNSVGPNNVRQGFNAYDPTNIANPTQQLNSFNSVGPNNVLQGINTYDPTNIANPTQQLNSFNPVGPNNVRQGFNAYDPTIIANPTQQLQNFNSVGPNNVRQGINTYDPTNTANPTQQLQNFNSVGPNNVRQGINTYDPTIIANPTQQLQNFNSVGPNNVRQGINTYDPTIIANPTQQLQNFNPVGPNNVRQGINTYDPTIIANPTQQLQNFNPVGPNNVRQGINTYDPTITANPTQQLQNFNPVGPNNVRQGFNAYDPTIIANPTQQLQSFNPVGPNYGGQISSYYDPEHLANPTQQLQSFNPVGPNYGGQISSYYDPEHLANPTQQLNSFNPVGPNYGGQISSYYDPTHLANPTQQLQTFNPMAPGNVGQGPNFYNPNDLAKQTQQGELVQKTNMGWLGTHQDSGYTVTDARAPLTLKQLINYNNHINGVGNQSIYSANSADATNWNAPITLKDIVKYEDYIGIAGNSYKTLDTVQYKNAHTNTSKEVVLKEREPTNSNVSMIPDKNSIGIVELKDQINIDRFNPPRQTNFNAARPEINQMNRTNITYGDNINKSQIDTLKTNPYYSNGVNQLYHYMNNPNYQQKIVNENSINHQLSVPKLPNQCNYLIPDHSQ
jgi:hypothetical protein